MRGMYRPPGPPASRCRLEDVRRREGEAHLILLSVEGGEIRAVVPNLGSEEQALPAPHVEGRRRTPELLAGVGGEPEYPAGPGAITIVHVVASQGESDLRHEVADEP